MNFVLLYSSVLNGIVCMLLQLLFYFPEYDVLYVITNLGIFTSIWNHGTTLDIAKWSDRICMVICVLVYIGFCKTLVDYSIIFAMIVFYFLAKFLRRYVFPFRVLFIKMFHVFTSDVCHSMVHLLFLALFGVIQLEKYHSRGFISPNESFTN